jgi:hypothetical protein
MEPSAKKFFFPPSPAFILGNKVSPTAQQKITFKKEAAEHTEELF